MQNFKLTWMALVSVGALTIASCGNKDRDNDDGSNRPKPKDAGMEMDSGTNPLDSGTPDSGNNNPPDGGMNPNDSGEPEPECAVNTDCPAPFTHCLNFNQNTLSLEQCAGQNTCACWQQCDPFVNVDQSGCARPAEACGFAGGSSAVPGVCLPDSGGGTQGMPCTGMFNGPEPFDNFVGDDCNASQNYSCHGADPISAAGTCARLCDTSNNALCTALDPNTECIPFAPNTTLGFCLTPITDLGAACTNDNECQGGTCLAALGGQCSNECGVTSLCPQDIGACVYIPGQLPPSCVVECTVGAAGDAMCSGINPNLICEDVGLSICIERCTDNADCPQNAPNCNMQTGHCTP